MDIKSFDILKIDIDSFNFKTTHMMMQYGVFLTILSILLMIIVTIAVISQYVSGRIKIGIPIFVITIEFLFIIGLLAFWIFAI